MSARGERPERKRTEDTARHARTGPGAGPAGGAAGGAGSGPGRELAEALRRAVRGGVDFSPGARALVTMDASNHRRIPLGVVAPRDAEDVAAALAVCADAGVPVVPRGGGTSIAGQATGLGVVLDLTRHMNRLHHLDPEARTAVVGPGLVLDALTAAARPHGLVFGPDPSTHSRCTLGGMIGNNACGAHSVARGTTADNVLDLDVVRYGGGPAHRIGRGWTGAPPGLPELIGAHLGPLRTGMPADFGRRVSGYALDALLPERGTDQARAFCGSEGTLGVLTRATVRLVPAPAAPALAVLGYPDESAAAEAAVGLLPHAPLTVEGMAEDLLGLAPGGARRGAGRLPRGAAWLFVEMPDEAAAHRVARAADALDTLVVTDPAARRALWRIREDAAGTAGRLPDGSPAWPGWEDCAVPPARLPAYLREFRALLAAHGLRGVPYGHFGEGCVHVRIDTDQVTDAGRARYRAFSADLADLVVAHGGSLSGEHGDGLARSEFLPRMYGPELIALFAAYKAAWDPRGGLNPGVLVRPGPFDAPERLRLTVLPRTAVLPRAAGTPGLAHGLAHGAAACVGVAKCRTADPAGAGVMCPSYRVTGEERHSTRGRARLLHEMLAGEVITDGWRSTEVHEALDLCLGCKGCASDCPAGVDMAAYKAEFLHRHWAGRIRPLVHYTLGGLPDWLRLTARLRLTLPAAALARIPGIGRAAGLDPRRPLPAPAPVPFTRAWARARARGTAPVPAPARVPASAPLPSPAGEAPPPPEPAAGPLLLWPDTFTEHLAPEVGRAALRVFADAGLPVTPPPPGALCCGLTYLSAGRLDRARRTLRRTLDTLGEALDDPAATVAVLEPSCAAALRSDLPALLPDDPRAARLAGAVRTFAETLEERAPHWSPPRLDRPLVGQTHCHQHAVLGDGPDRRLRARAGLVGEPGGGCCGLAGDFGLVSEHAEVSRAVAEETLLPALRAAPLGAVVQADGFSCRTQIAHHGPTTPGLPGGPPTPPRARHLAELLAEGLAARGRSV
ncbi:FAD-binding and (Fe-S)-binding domain-containing protein [Streptomyces sp. BI20]|uniref:FAD-binding and (Fe-S)-binding domain-containing protein n=1 Tax=Streptomyces sp. BI20 TaxID=3403460 RepID=UPI003C76D9EA